MRVRRLSIRNFRGITEGVVDFVGHTLLVGSNNIGKSTVCEALDLVLGPERLFRRPLIDEHDFYRSRYLAEDGNPTEISITAVLLDLPDEARRRFALHLRPWDDSKGTFADEGDASAADSATKETIWALPLLFLGRYDRKEDDFIGNTFFDHPISPLNTNDKEEAEVLLGGGRRIFTREHKRLCGFVFLRTLRTGSRALSLQRGSLLDTVLRLGDSGLSEMWVETLTNLRQLDPAIGEIQQLKRVRSEIRERLSRFVNLSVGDDATAFFASELTRDHLREIVRLFVSAQPDPHSVPFDRLGTGSINLLVFALLTFIADLKKSRSVIFAMEEPEIALPPHTQRRVTRFVLNEMGQSIITSHSPYVIEQFEPNQIVMLNRASGGKLFGQPVVLQGIKPKKFRQERRQFAEAILSRAVLVVEGATEAVLFPLASAIMEKSLGASKYTHFDLAGVSVFDAGGDSEMPRYGPVFKILGKKCFAFYDKPNKAFDNDAQAKLSSYDQHWESPDKGIENLLARETGVPVLRRFLEEASGQTDYPANCAVVSQDMGEDAVRGLAQKVLKERKGSGHAYSALLISKCQNAEEIPVTIRTILEVINDTLSVPDSPPENPTSATETVDVKKTGENPGGTSGGVAA